MGETAQKGKGLNMEILRYFSELTEQEQELIAKHMEQNPNVRFTEHFEANRDNDILRVRYSESMQYTYDVAKGEWYNEKLSEREKQHDR